MLLAGTVNIVNRLLPSTGLISKSKSCKTNIVVSTSVANGLEVSLHTAKNKEGVSYKITGNVQQIFQKFIKEGKLTIRFVQPAHDLSLTAAPEALARFVDIITGKTPVGSLSVNEAAGTCSSYVKKVAGKLPSRKTKLWITHKSDYPITTSFPDTLECLKINEICLKKVDRRILRLKHLTILDCSHNEIKELPQFDTSCLPSLDTLILSYNQIKQLPASIQNLSCLRHLDVSHNKLDTVPPQLCNLANLSKLCLNHNSILRLPFNLGKMKSLREALFAHNSLSALPSSLLELKLDTLDVFANTHAQDVTTKNIPVSWSPVASLKELAGRATLKQKMDLTEENVPWDVLHYLRNSTSCLCGKACLDHIFIAFVNCSLRRLGTSVSGPDVVALQTSFCSIRCFHKYQNSFAI